MAKSIETEFVDFDEADAESADAVISLKVAGKMYTVPASPEAGAMLRVRRLYAGISKFQVKGHLGKLSDDDSLQMVELADEVEVDELLGSLIGADIVKEWVDAKITDKKLKRIFQFLWRRYNGIPDDAPADGVEDPTAPKANRAARRATSRPKTSSKTGQPSKATSKGNTKSTPKKR